ncbi:CaiB/BaiF CoA-transferase family protein [Geomicrobium sp. JCM 19039]|uniref:CaiB/BaiF CoA transferase family protein n=1 Tax=Geomicrobium sp. JCM 19039 TaxID=1460636 RepID=UPI00045F1441|nr:CoA transferase [Geomicrobium sp. JCM 19039]GAK12629.1 L-carnitine dehydratase/bile acid-inducible protein F [Geomicrobium sp. JCM 19039]
MSDTSMPLKGIQVLELGTLLAGPFAGRLLADFGAEVIKIEPPDKPDPMRQWGKEKDGVGLWWPVQSRNKKSITLNLRTKEGQQVFKELAEKSDVIIENFRSGTMEKWGLGYDTLKEINPGLIMMRTTGYGQTGPYKDRAGFGSIGEAMGGIRYVTGFEDRPPARVGISIGDTLAALFSTIGCLTALVERQTSGQGQIIDTAIYESVFSVMESMIPDYLLADYVRERTGNILPGVAPSSIYRTKDDTYIVIGANADAVFTRLAKAMNQPELANYKDYASHVARGRNQKELDALIERWTKDLDASDALQILEDHGVPSGLIYSAEDIVKDPHYAARDMIVTTKHPVLGDFPMPGIVPKLSRTPGQIQHAGSVTPGEANEEIYESLLHITKEKLAQLQKQGVI